MRKMTKVFFAFCMLASTLSCEVSATILPIIKAVETLGNGPVAIEFTKENNPMLRTPCSKVEIFDNGLATFLDNMIETMIANKVNGLAAPQVNKSIRTFVIFNRNRVPIEFINPTITHKEGEQKIRERCLSIPELVVTTKRPSRVKGYAFNRKGEKFFFEAPNIIASIICQKCDYLDGILCTDKALEIEIEVESMINCCPTKSGPK